MIDARTLLDRIPHRPPFRFVDDVIELDDGRIVTTYRVEATAGFFPGHYPGDPIMPGVLLGEACFQTGALLMAYRLGGKSSAGVPVLTRIQDARFKRVVRPPRTLRIEVTLDQQLENAAYMTGRVTAEGETVLRVSFVCMMVEAQE